ncbi:MAG: phage holin family protein [Lachnospiraceae bacterium]|jgi:Phage holin protein (Holin_LLH).|nr:phage holin family protein [Lachnospiraceae bacterium]
MNDKLFDIVLMCIPILGAIITGFIIPYIKAKISVTRMAEIMEWTDKAVRAAEVIFDTPQCGSEKREYVIQFIDRMFNSKKQVITKDQIRILLEAVLKQMKQS